MNVIVPNHKAMRYYNHHVTYILNLLRQGGATVTETADTPKCINDTKFDVTIDGKNVLFDFADHADRHLDRAITQQYDTVFKMHYHPDLHSMFTNFRPLSPISWYDWDLYFKLNKEVQYKAHGPILNKQRPYGDATIRRTNVQRILRAQYGRFVDTTQSPHETFLRMGGQCIVSVCVPGATNNMLDIGQGQYMSLGVCTISPVLRSYGTWNILPKPNEHYLVCQDDYSDLISVIEQVRADPQQAIDIGINAKIQFLDYCTPERQVQWIRQSIA